VDAAELLESIQRICGAKAAIERVAIETRVQSTASAIYGDRVQLQQVLVNLVSNAIDASAGLPEQRKRVVVTAEVDATGARLSVSDLGAGLSGDDNDRVFRAHYTTKRDGLGIGLNVAHSIVTTHGGKLWATPNAGPGATFDVTLPPPPVDDLLATTTEKLPLLSENP
jgi:signal transduction histidine kinase